MSIKKTAADGRQGGMGQGKVHDKEGKKKKGVGHQKHWVRRSQKQMERV